MKKSTRTFKLALDRETIRSLDANALGAIVGGISGLRCDSWSCANDCQPSLRYSNCAACDTDTCTF